MVFPGLALPEHAPSISEELLYPDQKKLGLTPEFLFNRFVLYIEECRRLQAKYRDKIKISVAMEIETYSGYDTFVPSLMEQFSPEYLVGSVHFVDDMGIDYSAEQYNATAEKIGGIDKMYCHYFDIQFEMMERLRPSVVGHFDLVRIFDNDYQNRLQKPEIMSKIERNLEFIKKHDLIMDFNLRALTKGAQEPYISKAILERARELEIAVVPGDDSHGVSQVANHMSRAIEILSHHGFSTNWQKPRGAQTA
ncbi:related to histidinol-phosphatase [Desulfotalea psychrophila LSv54]|uniref:Histidinol-phosphatase n=1 Tax=Desulfotalea psychrophila (strain LSv54 / DSM 12343) TaxID=177439 RepID=Q6AS53_DESPS|nr:related to histidinol-phosphatase [Desulfotalea psychrophila LSv54]